MKNGFTLFELLAVIVVLALIALISTPIILNVIDSAKKGSFKETVNGVIRSANSYYAASLTDNTKASNITGTVNVIDLLDTNGDVPDGEVYINADGEIALAIYKDDMCFIKNFSETRASEYDMEGNINNCVISQ